MKDIITLTGSSGSGKTTIAKILTKNSSFVQLPNCTTRQKRTEDENGSYFLSKMEFAKLLAKEEMIEYDLFNENFYGTRKSVVEDFMNSTVETGILLLTQKGVLELHEYVSLYLKEQVNLFHFLLIPHSLELLESRILDRDSNLKRFEVAKNELNNNDSYARMPQNTHKIIVNDGNIAANEILTILKI